MPDWKKELREGLAHLNLEPAREESIVEEYSEHLSEEFAELVRSGVKKEEAYRKVLASLNRQTLGRSCARYLEQSHCLSRRVRMTPADCLLAWGKTSFGECARCD